MADLAAELAVLATADPSREYYVNGRNIRAVQFGPYPFPARIRVRAYGVHVRTGDNPSATLQLNRDGEAFGDARDQSFDRANLQVLNHLVLDPGHSVAFALDSQNHGATEAYIGLEFWFSMA
jgi:hypothetical protein